MGLEKKFDVIGIGAYAIDFIGVIPSFPSPNTKNNMLNFTYQGGGPVGTALVSLARLGANVGFIGKFGDNEFSYLALDEFKKEGIDTSLMIKEKNTGPLITVIIVEKENGNRTIFITEEMFSKIKKEEVSKEIIASTKILHLDEFQIEASIVAASYAKELGVKVVLDLESPNKQNLLSLIKLSDFLIIPENFATGFSKKNIEKSAEFFLSLGPECIVITQGEKGAFCKTNSKSFHQGIFKVDVVDTTGCGDVFHGSFIYGLLKGWEIEVIVEFASAVSALKCKKLGGRAGCPTFDEVKNFLLKNGSEEIKRTLKNETKEI